LRVKVVGCQYYNGVVHAREMATIIREPHNRYDSNAIRVDNMAGHQVGHIKANPFARALAPLADDPSPAIRLEVTFMQPHNMYDVDAIMTISGLPQYAGAIRQYLLSYGISSSLSPQLQAPKKETSRVVKVIQATPIHFSQKSLDAMFDQVKAELNIIDVKQIGAYIEKKPGIKTKPLTHQLQGLAWLTARESGFPLADAVKGIDGTDNPNLPLPPLWEKRSEKGRDVFFNVATNTSTPQQPNYAFGGILADEMGMGKTLSMLLLAALRRGKTLVVVPTSLIENWSSQAQEHTYLRPLIYHGQERNIANIDDYDVVITSYGTLTSEHAPRTGVDNAKRQKKASTGPLGFAWDRVILDEAHTIRNIKTKTFQAVMAIQARKRWCLTGTPLINKVDDFMALFQFVGAPPVDDPEVFKRCISRPIKNQDPAGLACLRVLVQSLSLRRSKAIINLPPRTLEIRYVDIFKNSFANQQTYDALFKTTAIGIKVLGDDALSNYTAILEVLTRLRQICSCGTTCLPPERVAAANLALARLEAGTDKDGSLSISKEEAVAILSRFKDSLSTDEQSFECSICLREINIDQARALPCTHFYCATCCDRLLASTPSKCAMCRQPISATDITPIEKVVEQQNNNAEPEPMDLTNEDDAPKLTAVMETLQELKEEKAVVFSQFVKTLTKLKDRLDATNISSDLFTGAISTAKRAAIVHSFQNDANGPRVLLVSLKCGGQGLNLTAASTVLLLDPWWNASTEDQALDRVHRIGQSKPVKAIKFVANKTIEERIVELQQSKKLLSEGSLTKISADKLRAARLGQLVELFKPFDEPSTSCIAATTSRSPLEPIKNA